MESRNTSRRFAISAARQRVLQRAIHLAAVLVVVFLVYSPGGEQVAPMVRWAALPLLIATGMAMWQAPRIRRLLKRTRARSETRKESAE